MIIGESDQRLSETNYYESPQKFEVLKRKFSSENEIVGENLSNFSDRSTASNYENQPDDKMHYIDSGLSEHYQTYQATEIHEDGGQSYINLTVLTPTLVQYDKNDSNLNQQMTNYANNIQHEDNKASPVNSNNKYEGRNYQHQTGKEACDNWPEKNDVINDQKFISRVNTGD